MVFDERINFDEIECNEFKEDSVREVIINPILKSLGYSAFGENKIVRSKNLKHPYIQFGTKKEHINIVPDYLCEVEGNSKFILDAKSPSECITMGKNVEQAFSYAIHREVKVQIYALCNGINLIIFHVDKLEPILDIKISELENRWEEVYRILSPIAFTKPNVFNFKQDFGIRLLKSGYDIKTEICFYNAWIGSLGRVNDDLFTLSLTVLFGDDCIGTFDFTREMFEDFLAQVPIDKKELIRNSLTAFPFKYHTMCKSESFEVSFSAMLSEKLYINENESYIPLNIKKFI